MTPAEYRTFCESTYTAPGAVDREEYLRLLLIEELGEVARLFAKAMRDGVRIHIGDSNCPNCGGTGFDTYQSDADIYGAEAVDRDRLKKELGDVMWCATMLTNTVFLRGWGDSDWKTATFGFDSRLELFELVLSDEFERLYSAASLCSFLGFDPREVALANVEKLKDRRGVIHGAGDER